MLKTVIGFDTSKAKLNFAIYQQGNLFDGQQINNDLKSILKCLKQLIAQFDSFMVIVDETGQYNYHLKTACEQLNIPLWVENATQLKRSLGLKRGKNDPIDAADTAEYGYRYQDKAKLYKSADMLTAKLKVMNRNRKKIQKCIHQLEVTMNEEMNFSDPEIQKINKANFSKIISDMKQKVKDIEKNALELVKGNKTIKKMYQLLDSLCGFGPQNIMSLILTTEAFTKFTNPNLYACFCGTAPFQHQSGTSIQKRDRVSNMANKRVKTLLFNAARSAIQHDPEINDYYQRKKKEGKHHMLIMNNVKNKLIKRAFAVIKRQTPYVKKTKEEIQNNK